jgi:serine protease Do
MREMSVVSLHVVEANEEEASIGSAVVIGPRGLLVTNAHVIEGGAVVHVRTMDNRDLPATIIGRDEESDLALLRCTEAEGLVPVVFGNSDTAPVGVFVVAIGNPYGFHHSVAFGVLSAKSRGLDDTGLEFLQTDAAINPGNSGGGLFDLEGRLLGITSRMFGPNRGSNVGLNFAIPVNVVKALLPQLQAGEVRHGQLGVSLHGVPAPGGGRLALKVEAVQPGGPADTAGLRPGDILLGATGTPPIPASRLYEAIWLSRPGSRFTLDVLRDGARRSVVVVTGQAPTTGA